MVSTIIRISVLGVIIFASTTTSSQQTEFDEDFAQELRKTVESLPPSPFGDSVQTNQAVISVKKLVLESPEKVLDMLTNDQESIYRPDAAIALSVAGRSITNLLPELRILLQNPATCEDVASVLPHIGQEGLTILASGLTNNNVVVRTYSALNLTSPLRYSGFVFEDLDKDYVRHYRESIKPFIKDWLNAIYDPEPRVGVAAAMGLRFTGTNEVVLHGLERAVNDPELDDRVRASVRTSIKVIKGELLSE